MTDDDAACTHPSLKQHTFQDGQTIKRCPDCAIFDLARARVLSPPHVQVTTKQPSPYISKNKVYLEEKR